MSKLEELIQELCPNGVNFKRIDSVTKVLRGKRLTKKELVENGEYPVFHGGLEPLGFYNQYNRDSETTMIINVGASAGTVGFCSKKFWSSDGCFCIENSPILDSKFIYLYLSSKEKDFISKVRHAGIPTLDKNVIEGYLIPVPPLEVQKEIVRLLDNFTAKAAELQNKINEELEARKKQYECYKDMLLNNSENFIITTIGDISESVTVGIANSATQAYSETGVTMLRNQNIKENYLDDNDLIYINNDFSMKYKNKLLKENDILVTRTGYPGVACVVPKKYESAQTFTTLIVRLQDLKKTNPKYVCYYINSLSGKQYVRKMQSGAAQQNFGATALSKMPINIPDITTQNYIVKIFENFDSTHSKISKTLLSELESRQKQYEFYRDKLLTFKELK